MYRQFIDINCDMGEALGVWRLSDTDDASLFPMISSANVATGFHAGDPNLMDRSVELALEHGVGIGAHPAYRDLLGFGRRRFDATARELIYDIAYQVGALREFVDWRGASLQHIKPHGALYMEMARNEELARSFVDYMRKAHPDTQIFCMDGSLTCSLAREAGQPVVREFFADREYGNDGMIVFTRKVGALDPQQVADKVLRACRDGQVVTHDGNVIDIAFDSICFHSDTPGCYEIARTMRDALDTAGVEICDPQTVLDKAGEKA